MTPNPSLLKSIESCKVSFSDENVAMSTLYPLVPSVQMKAPPSGWYVQHLHLVSWWTFIITIPLSEKCSAIDDAVYRTTGGAIVDTGVGVTTTTGGRFFTGADE